MTVYYGGDLCDSEDSDWEDPEDVACREYVDDYNFDLLEDMEPMVFVPGGNPSRFDRRDEYKTYLYDGDDARVPDDDSVVDRERRTWREYCASIFRKGLAPFPSDAPVSPPRSGRRDELCSHEDWMDTMPPEHHMGLRDIAHVPTSVSDEDEDWSDTSVSSHVEMPVMALNSEVVGVNERTVGVWGLPLTVCNSQFRSGASDGTLLSEGMTWLCVRTYPASAARPPDPSPSQYSYIWSIRSWVPSWDGRPPMIVRSHPHGRYS